MFACVVYIHDEAHQTFVLAVGSKSWFPGLLSHPDLFDPAHTYF